jgi:hypothetical protein
MTATSPATATPKATPKQFTLFKCSIQACQYYFKDGSRADFIGGRYATDDESKIEELQAEIEANHPNIYADEAELTTAAVIQDPLAHLRAKIRAEVEAEMLANPQQHGSTSADAGEGTGAVTSAAAVTAPKSDSVPTK